MQAAVTRRLVGVLAAVLLVGLARVGVAYTAGRDPGYDVTVRLGSAGSGLQPGSDVKVRGAVVGEVTSLDFVDARAVVRLRLQPRPRIPRDVQVAITAKTFLGEKQVELHPEGPLDPPYLQDGDVLDAREAPAEVMQVLDELERVVADIPPGDLAAIVDTLGAFDERDARTFGRTLETGEELAAFGARTADTQLARIRALADLLEGIAPAVDDLNRLARSLPRWTSLLPERQADLRRTLVSLSELSRSLTPLLETEQRTIARLLAALDTIGDVVEPRVHEVGRLVYGIYRYAVAFGNHGGSLDDGTEHSWFRAHIGEEGQFERLCDSLPPPLLAAAPGCVDEEGEDR